MKPIDLTALKAGMRLRDRANNGTRIYTVVEVFPSNSSHPGMLLEWQDPGCKRHGQAFTTRGWRKRWEVIQS